MGKILTMALKVGDEIRVSLVTGEKLRGPVQELTQTHAQVQGVRFALGDIEVEWTSTSVGTESLVAAMERGLYL